MGRFRNFIKKIANKKTLTALLTGATLLSPLPVYSDPLKMRDEPKPKLQLKLKELPKRRKITIKLPQTKEEKQMVFAGSSFGSSNFLRLTKSQGFFLNKSACLCYKTYGHTTLKYNFFKDKIVDKMRSFANLNLIFEKTPLDGIGNDLFSYRALANQDYGPYNLNEWFNLYRIFYDCSNKSLVGNEFKSKGIIGADIDSHIEFFTTHYFTRGKSLVRYDHGIRASALVKMGLGLQGNVKFGQGYDWGLHPLEKYFGSQIFLDFYYNYLVDLTTSESHQWAEKIKDGWQGLGIESQEFYRAKGEKNFNFYLLSSEEQMDELNLATIITQDLSTKRLEMGYSYLLYFFREQSFKKFWYYAMLGGSLSNLNYNFKNKSQSQRLEIYPDMMFSSKNKNEHSGEGSLKKFNLNFAGLCGFNIKDVAYPYFGFSNYPMPRTVNGFALTLPNFVANFILENNSFDENNFYPSLEFLMPISVDGDYKPPMLNYFKQKAINLISPFSVKVANTENAKNIAYSLLRGTFVAGSVNSNDANLSLLRNKNGFYWETGLEAYLKAEGAGGYIRFGYEKLGMVLGYAAKLNLKKKVEGHLGRLVLVGNFNNYFVKLNAKGFWQKRTEGYFNTAFDTILKNEKYAVLSVGGFF
ncbi:MAG: hypothetical protein U9Q69_03360 [Nanoarchaeota archaeon]|nr:hypothetical protein [Nanoarchaeota archaeon]